MAHVTFIARTLDGLILVETWDDANRVSGNLKTQAKKLLTRLQNMPARHSVDAEGDSVFHYKMEDGVCYMALFDKGYPKNYAFAFLEDVHKLFQEELKREFGTGAVDYRSHIETIEKPYYFIKFDRQIAKKKAEYREPGSSKAMGRLNENLTEVSTIMRSNIDEILTRGENLNDIGDRASKLKMESGKFQSMTRMLSFQTLVQKYGVPVVLGLVVILVICLKVFR